MIGASGERSSSARRSSFTTPVSVASETKVPGHSCSCSSRLPTTRGAWVASRTSRSNALGVRCNAVPSRNSWRCSASSVKTSNRNTIRSPANPSNLPESSHDLANGRLAPLPGLFTKEDSMKARLTHAGIRPILCLVLTGLLLSGATSAHADVVLQWDDIAVRTLTTQSPALTAFAQARFSAIVQLAVFEAVNAITGEYEGYLGSAAAADGLAI